jgi:predicted neutral ceramidase superfamily lipid hydrolase
MKPLKEAGNPLVLISATSIAGCILIAKRKDFRTKAIIAIGLLLSLTALIIVTRYLEGPWSNPIPYDKRNMVLLQQIESILDIGVFPLGYLAMDPITFAFLFVANCYLWAQCACWIIKLFNFSIRKSMKISYNENIPISEETNH